MKTTLNPFENAKRTAQGTGGGVSPAAIEEIQAEITILGSQNETQAQDITDIKAQLEELAGAYSSSKRDTGRKWLDGRTIYEKTFTVPALSATSTPLLVPHNENIDVVTHVYGNAKNNTTGTNFPLPFSAEANANLNIRIAVTTTDISIANNTDRSMLSASIVIEFVEPVTE